MGIIYNLLLQTFDCSCLSYFRVRIVASLYYAGFLTVNSLPSGIKFTRPIPLVSSNSSYLLSLIFFKESCLSGASRSKRSPLALNKGSLRNKTLEFCIFIDNTVFAVCLPTHLQHTLHTILHQHVPKQTQSFKTVSFLLHNQSGFDPAHNTTGMPEKLQQRLV